MDKDCLKKYSKILLLVFLFSCKGDNPLTPKKVDGALGPKYPDLTLKSLSPTDGQKGVILKPNIKLTFNQAVDPLSLTVNLNSSACIGSVQVSKNNFVTCEQLVPPISTPGNFIFTISPVFDLTELTYYKIKVTKAVFDSIGQALSNPFVSQIGFQTLDATPPTVKEVFPPDNSLEVNQNTGIGLIFSEEMDASSITANYFNNSCSGTLQVSKDSFFTCVMMDPPIYSTNGKSFVVYPSDPLESLQTYQVRALKQIKDKWGNQLSNEYISTGFKVKDWTPPIVGSTIPVNNSTDISFYTIISSTFSKKMDTSSIVVIESGNTCNGTFQLSKDNFSSCLPLDQPQVSDNLYNFIFKPKDTLEPGTQYKFKFTTEVKDLSGINLAAAFIGTFTTAFLPEVSSTSPVAGTVQVPATTTISVTFSKPMEPASIYSNPNSNNCDVGTFNLARESNPSECVPLGPVTASSDNRVFTATPIANLQNQGSFIIKVSHLVRDNKGNEMAADFVQSPAFRIYDTLPPILEAQNSSPSNNSQDFVPSDTITLRFDESMNPDSMGGLYTGSTRTTCIGTIQLSSNDFVDCIAFTQSNPISENNNKNFTVKPLGDLSLSTNYKIKVTTAAQDIFGNYMATPMVLNFRTLNPVEVQSTNPANALSPLVPKDTTINVTFNRAVLNSTIDFISSGSTCTGSIQLSMDNFVTCVSFQPQIFPGTQNISYTLTPNLSLSNYTLYKIRVLQTVMDSNNISMASTYTQSIGFKTVDTIPPVVLNTSPANSDTYVPRNTNLSVIFDEAIDPLTISTNSTSTNCTGSLQISNDNFSTCVKMTGQPIQSGNGTTWTMTPTSVLDNFSYYKFRVLAGVKDTQGNTMTTAYNQAPGFQTIDDIPPTLISSSPASGTTGVLSTANIILTFSEAMDLSSITTSPSSVCGTTSVQIQIGPTFSSCVPVLSTTSSASNTVFTIVPGSSLGNNGTAYKIKVSTSVQDAQGNNLVSTLNIPFRATDTITPSVINYSPADGSISQSIGSSLGVTFSEEINSASLITNQGADTSCTGKTWYAQVGGNCLLMNPFSQSSDFVSYSMVPQQFLPRASTVTVTIRDVRDITGNTQASPTTYSFMTNNPGLASLVIPNTPTEVLTNTVIRVGFDRSMNTTTLTAISSGSNCTGNIQLSKDNFASCIAFNSNLANPIGSGIYELVPTVNLAISSTYTVRVTTGVKTLTGDSWPVNQDFSFRTIVPPTVLTTIPADSAISISRNTPIDITFSKSMDFSTITTNSTNTNCWGSIQVSNSSSFGTCIQMAGNPTTVDNKSFRVTPASLLPNESQIYLRVTTSVMDTVGQNMLNQYNSFFNTRDEIQPTVVLTTPPNNATDVINDSNMNITFSESMSTPTVTVQGVGGTCSGSVQLSTNSSFTNCLGLTNLGFTSTNTTFNFKPANNLPNATTIYGRVTTAAKDLAGNSIAGNFNYSFFSNTVPIVSSITPISSATYVSPYTNIVVVFNKPMDFATFTNNTLNNCSNGNILFSSDPTFNTCQSILSQTPSNSTTTFTFTVLNPLAELTFFYFKIKNSVSDQVGMHPVSDFISSFKTGDSIPPTVASTNPAAGAINAAENLISVTFSENMATPTITPGDASCTTGNVLVSGDNFATCATMGSATTSDNLTFSFIPSPLLQPSTTYQIKVKRQVTDLSGNEMSSNYLQVPGFTVKDYIPPTVIASSPTPTSPNVPADATITVTFSETMNPTTVTSSTTTSCNANIAFWFSQDNFASCLPILNQSTTNQMTFNFVPLNGLYNATNYQYKVNTVVKDSAGNNLVAPYSSSFTVNDSSANTVTMTAPTNGSTGVPFGARAQSFSITFTNTVDSTTVTTNTGSTSCSGNVQLSGNNFVSCAKWSTAPTTIDNLNFNLGGVSDNLSPNTKYILKVSKDITTTAAGKSIKKDYMFTFTTDVSPTVTSLSPASGATDIPTFGPNTITVTFDTTMDPNTVVGATSNACNVGGVDLSQNAFATCLPLTSTSTDFRTFKLTPTSALVNNTRYHLRINSKATSSTGNPMVGYYPSISGQNFTTTNKPTIISTIPTIGALNVTRNTSFTINFSEPMVNVTTNGGFSTACSGTVQLSSDNFGSCVALNNPSNNANTNWYINQSTFFGWWGNLLSNTLYKLKVLGSVQAVRNNIPMGTDYISTFTTATTLASLSISSDNLGCEKDTSPLKVANPTVISWEKSLETLVNSPEGGYEIFYQKNGSELYCKKIRYENGDWTANKTSLELDKGVWKIRVKSFSRLNPQGSALSEIKEIQVP